MDFWKRPILRVPLVLCGLGILMRLVTYLTSFVWVRILIAFGSTEISVGPVTVVSTAIDFLLFFLAGWFFVRGLTRRQVFCSASIMVLINAALLAADQLVWGLVCSVGLPSVCPGGRQSMAGSIAVPHIWRHIHTIGGYRTICALFLPDFRKKRASPQEIRTVGKSEQKRRP